ISSSTGATILHGPHQVAQKSTSTGVGAPSTTSAKVASVTAVGVASLMGRSNQVGVGVHGFGQPPFGVDGGGAPGSGGGHRLPVGAVDQVAGGEDPRQRGRGGGGGHPHVALRVDVEGVAHQ